MATTSIPLNENQLEILKLFTRKLDNEDLIEIKRLIVKYLANKVTEMADTVWDEKKWTNEDMKTILETHKRTPYKSSKR